jgi:hypothetical protein
MKSHHFLATLFVISPGWAAAGVLYSYAGPTVFNETGEGTNLPGMTLSRAAAATDTLYFRYTVINPASNITNENYYAGMNLYEGTTGRLGVGNNWGAWAYSAWGTATGDRDLKSSTPEPSATYQMVRATDTTTFVVKVQYVAGGNDNVTVWLNPNLALGEGGQSASLTTTFAADASFNELHLREGAGGAGWNFSNVIVADSAADIGFSGDSDTDGLPDVWEQAIIDHAAAKVPPVTLTLADIKGPANAPDTSDYDADGSPDAEEFTRGTNPTDPDSDDDGLSDGAEAGMGTNPLKPDSDGDGLTDGVETNTGTWVSAANTGTNPLDTDSDDDFLTDAVESNSGIFVDASDTGTNPNLADADGDGANDRLEVFAGTNPALKTSAPAPGALALIGADDFTYDDGGIAGLTGGTGFDFDNNPLNDSFVGHTTRQSDWDSYTSALSVSGGKLLTQNNGAKREFNGFTEGVAANGDESLGAIHHDSDAKAVFLRADFTRGTDVTWSGISSLDFGTQRLFFGVPWSTGQSGSREFGIEESNISTTFNPINPIIPVAGRTYTIVAKIDFANDLLSLWVNPDLTKTEAENAPYLTRPYPGGNWSTAMLLSSGGTTPTAWDHAVAAREWSAVGIFPGVPPDTYANWIGGFSGAAGAPGFNQDADNDGVSNGVEHYLGTDPSVSSLDLRELSNTGGGFRFRHSRTNQLAGDVKASYQWSTDLVNWHASGQPAGSGVIATISTATITDNSPPALDEIEVSAVISTGTTASLFVRIVTEN